MELGSTQRVPVVCPRQVGCGEPHPVCLFFCCCCCCFVLFCWFCWVFFGIGPVIAVPMQRLRGAVSPLSARETLRDVGCHASSLFGRVRYTCGVTQVSGSGVESVPLAPLLQE